MLVKRFTNSAGAVVQASDPLNISWASQPLIVNLYS